MSPEEMAAEALGTLEEWLPGYTYPQDQSRAQDRLRLVDADTESVTILVQPMDHGPDQTFKITVTVEEIL